MDGEFNINCRWFIGEKPCRFKTLCSGCNHYSPMELKILIIKLAAIGDVLRTTPLLRAIKKRHPSSHITWLTDNNAFHMLKHNNFIDRLLPFNQENILRLQVEEFDILYSLDKEVRATALAEIVKARGKKGFSFSPKGNIYPLNKESHYAFMLGISDELKFEKNKKTYQEIIFEACGYDYEKDEYAVNILPEEKEEIKDYFKTLGIEKKDLIIGLNTGSGKIYASKKWTIEGFINLANKLNELKNVKILLLGGEDERERNSIIKEKVNFNIIDTGCNNSLRRFAAIISNCHIVVTGDTLALHLAVASQIPSLVFFGPTCHQEIELYGRGRKIITNDNCLPCYKRECTRKPSCIEKMDYNTVYGKIIEIIHEYYKEYNFQGE